MVSLLLATLFVLGIIGGFFSGLLGIGGGIVMVPLLLYVPSLLGLGVFDMKIVAGMTMVQSLGGSLSGLIVHRSNRFVHGPLVFIMGGPSVVGALMGSVWSKYLSANTMLALFAGLALLASVLLFLPVPNSTEEAGLSAVRFNRAAAALLGLAVGILGGIIGQGGAFFIIPLMLYVLRIPTRIALGSSVAISFLTALAGFIGKWGTEQIPFILALTLTLGAVFGAQIGGRISMRLRIITLRGVLALLIAATALRISFSLLANLGVNLVILYSSSFIAIAYVVYLIVRIRNQQNPTFSSHSVTKT